MAVERFRTQEMEDLVFKDRCFADVTFVSVSHETACVEVQDIVAAVRPNTCLISIMLANNETGVIMVSYSVTTETTQLTIREEI